MSLTRTYILPLFLFLCLAQQVYGQQTLTLQQTLRLARGNNPDLKVLEQGINAARADVTQSKIRPNPVFNMQLLHIADSKYRDEGTSWTSSANTQYWYQLTKPIQIAGQRSHKIEFANKMLSQSQLSYNDNARSVYMQAAMKWLDVWSVKVNLDILLEGKRNIDSLVLINEFRLRDKVITETDLARTQLLQQQYQRDIIIARQMLTNETLNLKYLLGTSDSVVIELNDPVFLNVNYPADSLIAAGTQKRSDVLSAKSMIEATSINIKLQKSIAYPQPEVGGVWNPQNNTPYWGFYGTVEIPIFNRNQGQREKVEVMKHQAEQNLLAVEKRAETEVTNAYRTYLTQQKNLADYETNLTKAKGILNSVRYSYLKGATSVVDFLEAQRSWLDTQVRYYQTMEDFRRSYVQLLYTTGYINRLAE